jgi:hypothetical protein
MTYPPCLKLYKSELNIIEKEITLLIRLRTASHVIGLPIAAFGLLSLIFPDILGSNITIDNLSKFTTVFFGGIFFASINLFNKGDLLTMRKRREDLLFFINEYKNYKEMTAAEKQKISDECKRIIEKRKGL